jgi:hypothetical protein
LCSKPQGVSKVIVRHDASKNGLFWKKRRKGHAKMNYKFGRRGLCTSPVFVFIAPIAFTNPILTIVEKITINLI